MKPGHYIDMLGIIAFTVLGVAHALPEAIIASGLTTILVGRLRPPTDNDHGPPPPAGGVLATSGLVAGVVGIGLLLSRLVPHDVAMLRRIG